MYEPRRGVYRVSVARIETFLDEASGRLEEEGEGDGLIHRPGFQERESGPQYEGWVCRATELQYTNV
jgi:hypothetical protein